MFLLPISPARIQGSFMVSASSIPLRHLTLLLPLDTPPLMFGHLAALICSHLSLHPPLLTVLLAQSHPSLLAFSRSTLPHSLPTSFGVPDITLSGDP